MAAMTEEHFNLIKAKLEETKSPNKNLVLAELKKAFPCLGCKWNNGRPNSACYNCEP